MSISFNSSPSIAVHYTNTILRPSYVMSMPSVRFFRVPFAVKSHIPRLCTADSGHTSTCLSNMCSSLVQPMLEARVVGFGQQFHGDAWILTGLKRYGASGILSYGLLNTAYYSTIFLVVWLYVAPSPGYMGYLAAAERFLKVMAMVWAGSQVTKLIRAGGALALAPFVDRGLSWFTIKFGFKSQGKAFMSISGFCFGLAFLLFVIVTVLWA